MLFFKPSHNASARLMRRGIAAFQLLVMLVLAVPACCYELGTAHAAKTPGISASAGNFDADQDSCPCCPAGEDGDTTTSCDTCSYCFLYAPLSGVATPSYAPHVTALVTSHPLLRLPEVHLPIFVPPQNFV